MRFWPFGKKEDSFETALSQLSTRIGAGESRLVQLHVQSRKWKALVLLYNILLYALYAFVEILVVGWHSWGIRDVFILFGWPVVIGLLRLGVGWFFDQQMTRQRNVLDALHVKQREKIEELKNRTNFYSTQSLIERYENSPNSSSSNLQEPVVDIRAGSPSIRQRINPRTDGSPRATEHSFQPKWYDKVLDIMIGEDESKPENRHALICQKCRFHNGLAPPGEKNLQSIVYVCPRCEFVNGRTSRPSSRAISDVPAGEEFKEDSS